MPANVDAMVREGINAFKDGHKEEARAFLMKAVEIDQYNEQAWLWLSAAVDTVEDQRTCLENVLAINPHNERARAGLQLITQQLTPPPSAEPPSSRNGMKGFYQPSTDWDTPAETARSSNGVGNPAPPAQEDSGDWLTNLGVSTPAVPSEPALPAHPDNSAPEPRFDGFALFDQEGSDDILAGGFASGPFSSADFEDVFTPVSMSSPPAAARVPASAPKYSPVMSPGREDEDPDDDDIENDALDRDLKSNGLFAEFDDDYDDSALGELNAQELFSYIPVEIKPTRLPGTHERYPALVLFGLLVLLILNIAAAALLVYRLG